MQSDAIIDTTPTISRINRRKGSESPMQKLMCAAVCVLSVGLAAYGETLTYQGGYLGFLFADVEGRVWCVRRLEGRGGRGVSGASNG